MIRLTTLGAIDLVAADGTRITSVLQQPKRLALLVYLALARPGGFVRRDTVLALFWPESNLNDARNALNQALHRLRRSLDAGVILSRGDEIGIAAGRLWCDALALEDAARRDERRTVADLYGGEFLDGFFAETSPDFEHWVDGWRTRLSRLAKGAAALPCPEPVPVRSHPERSDRPIGTRTPRFRSTGVVAVPLAIVLLLAVVVNARVNGELGEVADAVADQRALVEIHPFQDLTISDDLRHVAPATTKAVRARLLRAGLDVVAPEFSGDHAALARGGVPGTQRAGRFAIRGDVVGESGRVRIQVELVDVESGALVASRSTGSGTVDALDMVDGLARDVASFARSAIGRHLSAGARHAGTGTARARELLEQADRQMLRASGFTGEGSVAATAAALAHADSLLAVAEADAPLWPAIPMARGRAAADGAWVFLYYDDRDTVSFKRFLDRGKVHLDRAIALDSTHAAALELRGQLGYWRAMMIPVDPGIAIDLLGRVEADLHAAVAADPTRGRAWNLLGHIYHTRGRFGEAHWASTNAYDADLYLQSLPETLLRLVDTSYEIGDDAGALRWCDELRNTLPDHWTGAYCRLRLSSRSHGGTLPADTLWALVEQGSAHDTHGRTLAPRLEMLAASALARLFLADSAEAVARRARGISPDDPELLPLEADLRVALGQLDSARVLLERYVAGAPVKRSFVRASRRFAGLGVSEPAAPDR